MSILSINAGSSSLKFSLHTVKGGQVDDSPLLGGFEGLEPRGQPRLRYQHRGQVHSEALNPGPAPFSAALERLRVLLQEGVALPQAIAHRVVHGGDSFYQPVVVTGAILEALKRFNSLAPLHQPHNLAGIEAFMAAFPQLPQIACFDTAFHHGQPELSQRFALPQALHEQGIRRYGFHGLSYQYIMQALESVSSRAHGRVIMAHLGNGASLCGTLGGKSQISTMGFSALDGLMMGTRSGALDPGVLLYLLEQGWDHARIERLLYKESGLLGVSGLSADMRQLRANGHLAPVATAIALFTQRVVREIGGIAAQLEGLELLAFSGGIGEHDDQLRADVCQRLGWLGAAIDPEQNRCATGQTIQSIHTPASKVEVWVVPTDEGRVAAQLALECL